MTKLIFFISNFRLVLNVVRFLLGDSPASAFYMHIKCRRRGITQKKAYKKLIFAFQNFANALETLVAFRQGRTVIKDWKFGEMSRSKELS